MVRSREITEEELQAFVSQGPKDLHRKIAREFIEEGIWEKKGQE